MLLLKVVVAVFVLPMTAGAQTCAREKHQDEDVICNYTISAEERGIDITQAWGTGCAGGVRLKVNDSNPLSCLWMGKADTSSTRRHIQFGDSRSDTLYFKICCLLEKANHTFSIDCRKRSYDAGTIEFYISLGKPGVCFFLSEMNVLSLCTDKQQWCYMKPRLSSVQAALPSPSQTPLPIGIHRSLYRIWAHACGLYWPLVTLSCVNCTH